MKRQFEELDFQDQAVKDLVDCVFCRYKSMIENEKSMHCQDHLYNADFFSLSRMTFIILWDYWQPYLQIPGSFSNGLSPLPTSCPFAMHFYEQSIYGIIIFSGTQSFGFCCASIGRTEHWNIRIFLSGGLQPSATKSFCWHVIPRHLCRRELTIQQPRSR